MFIYTIRSKYATKAYINYTLEKVSLQIIFNRYKTMFNNNKLHGLINNLFSLGDCYISILDYYLLRPSVDELYTQIDKWHIFFNGETKEIKQEKETEEDIYIHNLKLIEQQQEIYTISKDNQEPEQQEQQQQQQEPEPEQQEESQEQADEPQADEQEQEPQADNPQAEKPKIKCVICNLLFNSKKEIKKHKRTKKHKENKEKYNQPKTEPKPQLKNGYYCDICNIRLKNKRSSYSHKKTGLHLKNLKQNKIEFN